MRKQSVVLPVLNREHDWEDSALPRSSSASLLFIFLSVSSLLLFSVNDMIFLNGDLKNLVHEGGVSSEETPETEFARTLKKSLVPHRTTPKLNRRMGELGDRQAMASKRNPSVLSFSKSYQISSDVPIVSSPYVNRGHAVYGARSTPFSFGVPFYPVENNFVITPILGWTSRSYSLTGYNSTTTNDFAVKRMHFDFEVGTQWHWGWWGASISAPLIQCGSSGGNPCLVTAGLKGGITVSY